MFYFTPTQFLAKSYSQITKNVIPPEVSEIREEVRTYVLRNIPEDEKIKLLTSDEDFGAVEDIPFYEWISRVYITQGVYVLNQAYSELLEQFPYYKDVPSIKYNIISYEKHILPTELKRIIFFHNVDKQLEDYSAPIEVYINLEEDLTMAINDILVEMREYAYQEYRKSLNLWY